MTHYLLVFFSEKILEGLLGAVEIPVSSQLKILLGENLYCHLRAQKNETLCLLNDDALAADLYSGTLKEIYVFLFQKP